MCFWREGLEDSIRKKYKDEDKTEPWWMSRLQGGCSLRDQGFLGAVSWQTGKHSRPQQSSLVTSSWSGHFKGEAFEDTVKTTALGETRQCSWSGATRTVNISEIQHSMWHTQAQIPCCRLSVEGLVLMPGTHTCICQSKPWCGSAMSNVHKERLKIAGQAKWVQYQSLILKEMSATSNFNTSWRVSTWSLKPHLNYCHAG